MTAETTVPADAEARREELIRQRLAGRLAGGRTGIAAVDRSGRLPLSYGQQRLWFHNVLDPQSAEYLVPLVLRLRGPLDVSALNRAWACLLERHEVLRTRYRLADAVPVQVVDAPPTAELPVTDLRTEPASLREPRAREIAAQHTSIPFELSLEHPVRARLIRLSEQDHVLAVALHHIACDGWSLDIMVRELFTSYTHGGAADPLPVPAIQYADYAVWQRDRLVGPELDRLLAYWREQLAGLAPLELPTDRPRAAVRDWAGDRVVFTVPAEVAGALHQVADDHDMTLFGLALTAFQALLARYTGQRDIAVGSAVTGRDRTELHDLVGFFLNTVVLRLRWQGDPTVSELLQRNRGTILSAFEHQEAPIQLLVDDVDAERDRSRTPLFQVMFDLADSTPSQFTLPDLSVAHVDVVGAVAKHDLRVEIAEQSDGTLRGVVEYATALFDGDTVTRLAAQYSQLLSQVAENPNVRVSDVDLFEPHERSWLRQHCEGPRRSYPALPVEQQVCAHAAVAPDSTAVRSDGTSVSYGELDRRANQLAHHLRRRGVGRGSVVVVCLDRKAALLPALLAVWRAGAAYVPVDPTDPASRVAAILDDSAAAVVITESAYVHLVPPDTEVVDVDADASAISAELTERPDTPSQFDDVAYLIYTSGSTGRPKGVQVSHGALHNYLSWAAERYISPDGAGAPLLSSIAFDLSVTALYVPLLAGQQVHLLPADIGPGELGQALATAAAGGRFSFVKLTPGHLDLISQQLTAAQAAELTDTLVVGGEALTARLAARWLALAPHARVINEYGPTENTVANIAYEFVDAEADDNGRVLPIGRPTANTSAWVLDDQLQPTPIGVVGELFLGGTQVAQGYHGAPALTAARFLPDPYGGAGTRMYRTGDRARLLANGDVEFLGRLDDQAKVRGYRVEPAEVAATLTRHPGVHQAVVTVRDTAAGGRTLVGYLVPSDSTGVDIGQVRDFLEAQLPVYLRPSALVVLDEIPLTSSGKTDVAALPDPERQALPVAAQAAAPRSPVQEQIATVWCDVLGITDTGVDDNFFELGGDSLSAVALVGDLRDLGFDVTVQHVFEAPTIAGLAELVAQRPEAPASDPRVGPFELLTQADREKVPDGVIDVFPASMLQAGMVYEMFSGGAVNYYHNATTYPIRDDAPFSIEALQEAVDVLVARHEVLRTGFDVSTFSEPMQLVHAVAALPVGWQDLRGYGRQEQNEQIRRYMAAERERRFDLDQPPLLRLFAHVRDDHDWSLTITECHPILEGWSYHLLLMELVTLYRQLRTGESAPEHTPLDIRFVDFIAAERRSLASEEDRSYWQRVVTEHSRFTLPPSWGQKVEGPRGPYRVEIMFADLEEGLRRVATEAEVPLKSVLHAAHLKVLSMLTHEREFFDGLVCDTRPEVAGADRLYGLFLNTVPFPFELTARTWRDLARDVFAREVDLWPHRRYPMGAMQRDLSGGQRLVEVMFNYLDFRTVDTEVVDFGASMDDSPNEFALAVTAFRQGLLTLRIHPEAVTRPNGERLAEMYRLVLAAMAADPDGDARATYLPAEERRRLLTDWNATSSPRAADTLVDLFAAQVDAVADADAVVTATGERVTFHQLDRRANQLAHYLIGRGVGPGATVAVCQQPGVDLLVSLLGIAKAGAGYLPLDPSHPQQRLAFALDDSAAGWLVAQEQTIDALPSFRGQWIMIDDDWSEISDEPAQAPARRVEPADVVYTIYTSGSTGQPKGVMVTHRGLANYLSWATREYVTPGRTGAPMLGSVAFDLPVTNLLVPLISGQAVRLLPLDQEVPAVADLLRGPEEFSLLKLTPGHLDLLCAELPAGTATESVGTFVVGGEQLASETVRAWRMLAPGSRVINEYGPTETVVGCSVYEVPHHSDPASRAPVPIGRPIANTRMYVLDRDGCPVPAGVVGELYIGGDGVARGYHARPATTAQRFLPDPFGPPGERLYRSGDLCRMLPHGELEFLGRIDDQVKVNGFRIEPAEVEAGLLAQPEVAEALVTAHHSDGGGKRLVAYVAGSEGAALADIDLRARLRSDLPEYLVPDLFMVLDRLPRTAAGKVDRAALPDPAGTRPDLAVTFTAPRNATERRLVDMWRRVLGVDRVGVHDNLTDLGADSITGLRVAAEAVELGLDMSPMDAIAYPTVAELAHHLLGGGDEELIAEVIADAALPPDIRPSDQPAAHPDAPVLLTGATGFVGAYLLRELLAAGRQVVCIVRAEDDEAAAHRLTTTLAERGLSAPPADQVEVIAGDLAHTRLGLSQERYEALAQHVGAICHAGASTNAVWAYRSMRPVNVGGTREILRLASTGPVKPVHHVSTLSVFSVSALGDYVDEDSVPGMPPGGANGYGQSKWAAEALVREAAARGIPTTIYRMGKVSWDTQTGGYNPDDLVSRTVQASIEVGMAPTLGLAMTLTPVDYVAAGIVFAMAHPQAPGRCVHLVSSHRIEWSDTVEWIRAQGVPLAAADYGQWREAVAARSMQAGGEHLRPLLLLVPEDPQGMATEEGMLDDYIPPVSTWLDTVWRTSPAVRQADVATFLQRMTARG